MVDSKVAALVNMEELTGVKWESPKERTSMLTKIGNIPGVTGVWARIVIACWLFGMIAMRKSNSKVTPAECFDAWYAGRIAPGGPGALADKSLPTYRSVMELMVTAAHKLPYDSEPVRDFCILHLSGIGFGSRAGVLRNLMSQYPKTCPTLDQMKALLVSNAFNLSDELATVTKRLAALAEREEARAAIASNGLTDAFKAANAAATKLAAASAKVIPVTPPKRGGKQVSAEVAALLKV